MNRIAAVGVPAALVLMGFALVGCPQSSGNPVAGETATAPERNAFDESEFSDNPQLAARLEHTVTLYLEAAGSHPGDTGSEDGVDEIPYDLKSPTLISLAIPLDEQRGHWLEWCDKSGRPLLFARGKTASSRALLNSGRYLVRVHHTRAHERGEMMFLRANQSVGVGTKELTAQLVTSDGSMCTKITTTTNLQESVVTITGNLSCANIVGGNFTPPRGYGYRSQDNGGIRPIEFDAVSNATFVNCTFVGSPVTGTISDSTFTNCWFVNSHWEGFQARNTTFNGCHFTNEGGLGGLDVSECTLNNCDFSNSKCRGAKFAAATLRNCNYSGCDFDGAIFDNCRSAFEPTFSNTLTDVSYAGVSVQQLNFEGLVLSSYTKQWNRANFSGSDLSGQTLTDLTLTGAAWIGTTLNQAVCVNNSTLIASDFTGAKIENANFSGCNFAGAIFDRVTGAATDFSSCTFDEISGHGADFTFANLARASFAGAQLGSTSDGGAAPAYFSYAYMPNVRITDGADCRNVDFSYAHVYGANASVQNVDLTAANFTGAIVSGMDFSSATLNSASFDNAQAVATRFTRARLNNAHFVAAYLMGADFSDADTANITFVDAAVSTAPCNNSVGCATCLAASCSFADLDPSNLCCYSFSEASGSVYAVSFGATVLPTDSSVICPNGEFGPCSGAKLTPRGKGPFPAVPACVPSPLNWCPAPTKS